MRCVTTLLLAAAAATAGDAVTELLFYRPLRGSGSDPRVLEMRVDSDGSGYVALQFKDEAPTEVRLHLTAAEREEVARFLREAVRAPAPKRANALLRATLDGKAVEREVGRGSAGEAWHRFLASLLEQGRCQAMLARGRGVAETGAALESGKVYQPRVLSGPLQRVLGDVEDKKEFGKGLRALARTGTPGAWTHFIDDALERNEGRRDYVLALLASKSFRRGLPAAHADALPPLLLSQVEREAKEWRKLDKPRRKAVRAVLRDLGNRRYAPAVPLLVGMLTDLSTDEKIWIDPALLAMGRAAVEPLMRLCRDPRPLARRAAVTALERMVPRAPKRARGDKMVPTIEQRVFIDYLREVCKRGVADLAENDPDASVRKAATRAAKRFEQGWVPPQR